MEKELEELIELLEQAAEREGFTVTQYEKEEIKEEIKNALNEYSSVVEHFKQLAEQNIPIHFAPSYIICARLVRRFGEGRKVFEVGVTARTIFAKTYIDHPDLLPVPRIIFEQR